MNFRTLSVELSSDLQVIKYKSRYFGRNKENPVECLFKMVFNLGSCLIAYGIKSQLALCWVFLYVATLTTFPIHSINIELTDTIHMKVYARGREGPILKILVSTRDRKENKKRKYLLQVTLLVIRSNSRRNQKDLFY